MSGDMLSIDLLSLSKSINEYPLLSKYKTKGSLASEGADEVLTPNNGLNRGRFNISLYNNSVFQELTSDIINKTVILSLFLIIFTLEGSDI